MASNGGSILKDPSSFEKKTIVITGAGGSFGREGCWYFFQQGCNIAALDNNLQALQQTKQYITEQLQSQLQSQGQADTADSSVDDRLLLLESNVTSAESVQSAIDSVVAKFPTGIQLLWNNAGYQGRIEPTLEYDIADFRRVMDINVTGMFIVLQAVAKQMVKQTSDQEQQGHSQYAIVNTASVAGLRGTPAMIAYASSKAAVLAMTVSSSKDLAPYGIRVNAISPALIGPEDGFMWKRQNEMHAACSSPYFANDAETVAKNKVNGVPLKRLGTIGEVVQSVSYLLSVQSSYTTGTNLVVDGGMSSGLKC